MKKVLLMLLVLMLCGCGVDTAKKLDNYSAKTDNLEVLQIPETTCDPCSVTTDDKSEEKNYIDLLGFDPYLADNVVLRAGRKGLGVETDQSTCKTLFIEKGRKFLAVRDGLLSVTNIETGEYFEYQSPSDFKALAEYVTCGGDYFVYALTDSGEVYQLNMNILQYSLTFEPEDILNSLISLNLDKKVSALAVKDYKNIYSTCGSFGVYVVDSKGVERYIQHKATESGIVYTIGDPTLKSAYIDFIRINETDQIAGTPESPVEYLVLMLDGTVHFALDYNEFDLRIEKTGLKNEQGKVILATKIMKAEDENGVKVYIVSDDGMLYLYSDGAVSKVGKCVAVMNQGNIDYPVAVQIVLENGEPINILNN